MLQGRLFAYGDAHRYRLGVNADLIPVNRPHCPVSNYHRDGYMRVDENGGGSVNYEPNSFDGPVSDTHYNYPPLSLEGAADHYEQDHDFYTQPGDLYRLLPADEKDRLTSNFTAATADVPEHIRIRAIARFYQARQKIAVKIWHGKQASISIKFWKKSNASKRKKDNLHRYVRCEILPSFRGFVFVYSL